MKGGGECSHVVVFFLKWFQDKISNSSKIPKELLLLGLQQPCHGHFSPDLLCDLRRSGECSWSGNAGCSTKDSVHRSVDPVLFRSHSEVDKKAKNATENTIAQLAECDGVDTFDDSV